MEIDILSLFPEYFNGPFNVSIIKRALERKIIEIRQVNIRDFSKDKHKKVDERPYGGGPGMVMTPQPISDAIKSVRKKDSHLIYLSPQGTPLTSLKCKELARYPHLILLCGHYEGIDARVKVDEEISIGDYVLTNGAPAACVLIDATIRFIPGVLGNENAMGEDSFEELPFEGPQYTRPDEFEGIKVPEILKSGNHAEIKKWRASQGMQKVKRVRPDLLKKEKNCELR